MSFWEPTVTTPVADNLLPDTDNARDLGSALFRWKDLYLAGGLNVAGSAFGTLSSYVPTTATLGNLASVTLGNFYYTVLGKLVLIVGDFAMDPTNPNASTSFRLGLPVARTFNNNSQAFGVAIRRNISLAPLTFMAGSSAALVNAVTLQGFSDATVSNENYQLFLAYTLP